MSETKTRGKKTKFGFDPETGDYFDEEFDNFQSMSDTYGDDESLIDDYDE